MSKSSRRIVLGAAGLAIIAIVTGMIFSRLYWGYWIHPPSLVPWVYQLQSVEARGFVECKPDTVARAHDIPDSDLHQGAAAYRESQKDYPGYQLLAALEVTQLPIAQAILADRDANMLCQGLFASGIVLSGAAGYEYARYVRGFVVNGRTRSGERVWIWSAIGGEVSNDHHPVYDLEFSNSGTLTRSHLYFEDIAGFEGTRWYVICIVVFVAGALLFAAIFSIVVTARFVTRRLRRLAAGSGRHN
jgi:hypothetical protein